MKLIWNHCSASTVLAESMHVALIIVLRYREIYVKQFGKWITGNMWDDARKITVAAVEFATFQPMGMCREGLVLFALCRTIGVIGLITPRNYPELIEINRLISTTFVVA